MQRGARLRRRWLALAVLAQAAVGAAQAQTVDCNRLQAAINSPQADQGARAAQYRRSAERQRYELERTRSYAESIGCDEGAFSVFADAPPPQCRAIQDRVSRMEDNLAQMEAQSQRAAPDDEQRRAELIARYNAACSGGNPADLAQDRGQGWGSYGTDGRGASDLRTIPVDPDELSTVPLNGDISGESSERVAGKAICVRSCDGGYFPMTASPRQDALDGLDQLCKASCPNTEARLYTMGAAGDLGSATAVDGTPYSSLPAAFKFEKSYSASCTCKPPNQSWVEALAQAEKLLGGGAKGDVTVTAKMSEDLSKPAGVPDAKSKKSSRAAKALPTVPSYVDMSAATDGLRGSQAPTASEASAGIAAAPVRSDAPVKAGDGPTRTVAGPDGVKRTIRIIVP